MGESQVRDNMEATPNTVTIQIPVEIYLKDRQDPIHALQALTFDRDGLPTDVEQLTDFFVQKILAQMDSRSIFTMIFEDERHTKVLVATDRVDSISVIAPDELPEDWHDESD